MLKNLISFTLVVFIFLFFYFIIREYYSITNKEKLVINRSNIDKNLIIKTTDLLVLPNDTNSVIEFNNEYKINEKKKNRNFWNLFRKK